MVNLVVSLIAFGIVVILLNVLTKALKQEQAEEKRKNDSIVFACLEIGEYYSQKNKVLKEFFKNGNR